MSIVATVFTSFVGFVIYLPVALVAYLNIDEVFRLFKTERNNPIPGRLAKKSREVCAIDGDCPPGYFCQDGICMPQSAK
jgi:hypothetical protein